MPPPPAGRPSGSSEAQEDREEGWLEDKEMDVDGVEDRDEEDGEEGVDEDDGEEGQEEDEEDQGEVTEGEALRRQAALHLAQAAEQPLLDSDEEDDFI